MKKTLNYICYYGLLLVLVLAVIWLVTDHNQDKQLEETINSMKTSIENYKQENIFASEMIRELKIKIQEQKEAIKEKEKKEKLIKARLEKSEKEREEAIEKAKVAPPNELVIKTWEIIGNTEVNYLNSGKFEFSLSAFRANAQKLFQYESLDAMSKEYKKLIKSKDEAINILNDSIEKENKAFYLLSQNKKECDDLVERLRIDLKLLKKKQAKKNLINIGKGLGIGLALGAVLFK